MCFQATVFSRQADSLLLSSLFWYKMKGIYANRCWLDHTGSGVTGCVGFQQRCLEELKDRSSNKNYTTALNVSVIEQRL